MADFSDEEMLFYSAGSSEGMLRVCPHLRGDGEGHCLNEEYYEYDEEAEKVGSDSLYWEDRLWP
jgi:hypothetical protein